MKETASLFIARRFLGETVDIVIDRPLGSSHPKHGYVYEANYGYVEWVVAPDGECLDAYFLGTDEPLANATGICVAIAHRRDDDDDKLVVVPTGTDMDDAAIMAAIAFQERWFDTVIVRA